MSSALERIEKAIETLDIKVSEALSIKHKGVVCSFCGKHQSEAKKIVSGPGVCICDGCICTCCDILSDHGVLSVNGNEMRYEVVLKEEAPKT